MIRRGKRRQAAILLGEMLVCLALLTVIIGISAVSFAEIVRMRGMQERYNRRVDAADYLLRAVARDVRAAGAFVSSAGSYKVGPGVIILSREGGCVIYARSKVGMERIEVAPAGAVKTMTVLDAPGVTVRFDCEGPLDSARSLATTVEWDEPPAVGVSHPVLSQRVALRGAGAAGTPTSNAEREP